MLRNVLICRYCGNGWLTTVACIVSVLGLGCRPKTTGKVRIDEIPPYLEAKLGCGELAFDISEMLAAGVTDIGGIAELADALNDNSTNKITIVNKNEIRLSQIPTNQFHCALAWSNSTYGGDVAVVWTKVKYGGEKVLFVTMNGKVGLEWQPEFLRRIRGQIANGVIIIEPYF